MMRRITVSDTADRHFFASGVHTAAFNADLMPHVPIIPSEMQTLLDVARDVRTHCTADLTVDAHLMLTDLLVQYGYLLERENAPVDERIRCAKALAVMYPDGTPTGARWYDLHRARPTHRSVTLTFCDGDNAVRSALLRMCKTPRLLDIAKLSHTEVCTARRLLGRLHDVYPKQHITHQSSHYAVTPREFDLLYRMLAVARTFAFEPNPHAFAWLKSYPEALDACFKCWKYQRKHKTHDQSHWARYAPFLPDAALAPESIQKGDTL